MLKIHIDAHTKNPICKIEVDGTLVTILSDILIAVNNIYNTLLLHDPEGAEEYKVSLKRAFAEADYLLFARSDMNGYNVEAMSYETPE